MPTPNKVLSIQQAETDIAVLQVQVKNIEDKVGEIKFDVKEINTAISKNNEDTYKLLQEMKEASATAHKNMADKINSLEKWRWMMMGAGVVLGTLGYDTLAKLLK